MPGNVKVAQANMNITSDINSPCLKRHLWSEESILDCTGQQLAFILSGRVCKKQPLRSLLLPQQQCVHPMPVVQVQVRVQGSLSGPTRQLSISGCTTSRVPFETRLFLPKGASWLPGLPKDTMYLSQLSLPQPQS